MNTKNFFLAILVIATSALIGACIACAEPIPQDELLEVRAQVYTELSSISGVEGLPETYEAAMKDRPQVFTKANSDYLLTCTKCAPKTVGDAITITTGESPYGASSKGRTYITYSAACTVLAKGDKSVVVKVAPSITNKSRWDASAGLTIPRLKSIGSELPPRRILPPKVWEAAHDAERYAPLWDLWSPDKYEIPQMDKLYSAHPALPEGSQSTIIATLQAIPYGFAEFDRRLGKGWSKKAFMAFTIPTKRPGQPAAEEDPESSFSKLISLLAAVYAQHYPVPGMEARCDAWVQKAQAEDFDAGIMYVMPISYKQTIKSLEKAGYRIANTVMVPVESFEYYTF